MSHAGSEGSGGNRFVHNNFRRPFSGEISIASWNVEGLTDIKIHELCNIMRSRALGFLCLQEVKILIQAAVY